MSWQERDEATKAKYWAKNEARERVFLRAVKSASTVEDLRQVLVVLVNMIFRDNPTIADHLAAAPGETSLIFAMEAAAVAAGEQFDAPKELPSEILDGDQPTDDQPYGHEVEVKRNNTLSNDPCAFCGGRCHPGGIDVFKKGTSDLVCDSCANASTGLDLPTLRDNFENAEDQKVGSVLGIGLRKIVQVALACPAQGREREEEIWREISQKIEKLVGRSLEFYLNDSAHGHHIMPELTASEKAALPNDFWRWLADQEGQ